MPRSRPLLLARRRRADFTRPLPGPGVHLAFTLTGLPCAGISCPAPASSRSRRRDRPRRRPKMSSPVSWISRVPLKWRSGLAARHPPPRRSVMVARPPPSHGSTSAALSDRLLSTRERASSSREVPDPGPRDACRIDPTTIARARGIGISRQTRRPRCGQANAARVRPRSGSGGTPTRVRGRQRSPTRPVSRRSSRAPSLGVGRSAARPSHRRGAGALRARERFACDDGARSRRDAARVGPASGGGRRDVCSRTAPSRTGSARTRRARRAATRARASASVRVPSARLAPARRHRASPGASVRWSSPPTSTAMSAAARPDGRSAQHTAGAEPGS